MIKLHKSLSESIMTDGMLADFPRVLGKFIGDKLTRMALNQKQYTLLVGLESICFTFSYWSAHIKWHYCVHILVLDSVSSGFLSDPGSFVLLVVFNIESLFMNTERLIRKGQPYL